VLELGSAVAISANVLKGEVARLAETVLERHEGDNNCNMVHASIEGSNSSGASIAANSVVAVDEAEAAVNTVHVPSSTSVSRGSRSIEDDVTIRGSLRGASNHGHVRTDVRNGGIVLDREGAGLWSNDHNGCGGRNGSEARDQEIHIIDGI